MALKLPQDDLLASPHCKTMQISSILMAFFLFVREYEGLLMVKYYRNYIGRQVTASTIMSQKLRGTGQL